MKSVIVLLLVCLTQLGTAGEETVLFDGKNLDAFDFAEGSWVIDSDGAITCKMEEVKGKDGKTKLRGKGDIWSKEQYEDFELTLSYKLSEGANSGVFYRVTNKENSVQNGFEIQLMDNEGFQKTHGKKDLRKLNGSFYDAKGPSSHPENPPGEWNTFKLRCEGPIIQCWINGTQTFKVNVDEWTTPLKNPDGTTNKFKTALKDLPRKGFVGMQNHGQYVWFKDVVIERL